LSEAELKKLADALCTEEGSYFTGIWCSSANGSTLRDFNATVGTSAINIHPAFIAPVAKELAGTWSCTYSGKVYDFTLDFQTDANGKITGVTAKAAIDGVESEASLIRTYIKAGQLPQLIIKTSAKSYTIKQVDDGNGGYKWQYSSQDLAKK